MGQLSIKFCSNCGAEIREGYRFCEQCGQALTLAQNYVKKGIYRTEQTYNKKKWNIRHLVACFFITGILGVSFIGLIVVQWISSETHNYIGSTFYTVETTPNATSLNLAIDMYDDVNINYQKNMDNLFEAEVKVYAKKGHDLEGSDRFTGDITNKTYYIKFLDSNPGAEFVSWHYSYKIFVNISTQISTALNVYSAYKDITLNATHANLSNIDLFTYWGDINAIFQETFIIGTRYTLSSHHDNVRATFIDVNYQNNQTEWRIDTWEAYEDGDVYVEISQNNIPDFNCSVIYNIISDEESVYLSHLLHFSIGHKLVVYKGNVRLVGYPSDTIFLYESTTYQNATMKYDIILAANKTVSVTQL